MAYFFSGNIGQKTHPSGVNSSNRDSKVFYLKNGFQKGSVASDT